MRFIRNKRLNVYTQHCELKLYESGHEKTCLIPYANKKGADPRSLISAIFVRCLDNTVLILAESQISGLWLVSVGKQADLSLAWSQTPEDMFSHDEAHIQ